MGAAASLASHGIWCKAVGPQHQQQTKPRKQKQQQQQQQDWASALEVVLAHTSEADDIDVAECHTERALHGVNKQLRAAACATISHLSLWSYSHGCEQAKRAWQDTETFSAALAAAAGVPTVPWTLLATTPCLTSLELNSSQAHQLTAGGSISGAAEAQGGTCQVLAAPLARLQCLRISSIGSESELRHVGWILGHCTRLTQLQMNGSCETSDALWDGLRAWTATAAAAEAARTAGRWPSSYLLPALCHLELSGDCTALVNDFLGFPLVARQMTAVHLRDIANHLCTGNTWETGIDWCDVMGCSGLRELVLEYNRSYDVQELPEDLDQLTALTKLVVEEVNFREVPAAVCSLKQLRHLDLSFCRPLATIPSSISQLQHLQELRINRTKVEQLPEELGTWLPQLQVLEATRTGISTIPKGLTRLTRLVADDCENSGLQLSAVQHLVALKCLQLHDYLKPPFQPLSRLVALETLCTGWSTWLSEEEAAAVCIPGPLPNLCSLNLTAGSAIPAGGLQLLVGAHQLTHLSLKLDYESGQEGDQLAALWQVGVLPQLQELAITYAHSGAHPAVLQAPPALPWLQQQPRLTSLCLTCVALEASQLEQLPCQLESRVLDKCDLGDDLPAVLTHLTRLHTLKLPVTSQVPQWLPCLPRLEELQVDLDYFQRASDVAGWEVLGQLPLLRRGLNIAEAFPHAPHLCWSSQCWQDLE